MKFLFDLEKRHPNWRTTVSGWVTVIAVGIAAKPELIGFLPEDWQKTISGVCGIIALAAGGTFATVAKDSAVTGGKVLNATTGAWRVAGDKEDKIPGI